MGLYLIAEGRRSVENSAGSTRWPMTRSCACPLICCQDASSGILMRIWPNYLVFPKCDVRLVHVFGMALNKLILLRRDPDIFKRNIFRVITNDAVGAFEVQLLEVDVLNGLLFEAIYPQTDSRAG